MMETPVPDSVSAVPNATNATRDFESELEAGQDGKTFHKDIADSEPTVCTNYNYCLYPSLLKYAYK